MARLARVVILGIPHHVIQRGNRRQKVFFEDEDKTAYLRILKKQSWEFHLSVWAYCLMDNHVHLIVVPNEERGLSRGIGETNRLYTRMIHFREGWRGYLWQGRFNSYPMDEKHLYSAVRYVERNPVRAGIVKKASNYPWSSAHAHVYKVDDELLDKFYLNDEIGNWERYLESGDQEGDINIIRSHARTGRPLGGEKFIKKLEGISGRILKKRKPGPRKRN